MIPIGHASTHIPHAIHLLGTGFSSTFAIIPFGHTSAHVIHPVHNFLFIIYTPLAFSLIAPSGHFLAQTPHWLQTFTSNESSFLLPIFIQEVPSE